MVGEGDRGENPRKRKVGREKGRGRGRGRDASGARPQTSPPLERLL